MDNPFADPSVSGAETAPLASNADFGGAGVGAEAPSWLEEPKPQPQAPPGGGYAPPGQMGGQGSETPVDPRVPQIVRNTRIANMLLAVGMGVAAVLSLASSDLTEGVIACYILVFSCLICCYETHLKQVQKTIANNFGFLFNAKGRAVFLTMVGCLLFSIGGIFGTVMGALMLANVAFNVYAIVKFPEFDDYQRKSAQAEIKEYLDSHPELSRKAMSAGVNFARNNPDIVKQGAEAYFSSSSAGQQPSRQASGDFFPPRAEGGNTYV